MARSLSTSRCRIVAVVLALGWAHGSTAASVHVVASDPLAARDMAAGDTTWREVSRVGGVIRAVAAEDDRAYIVLGPRVLVLDAKAPGSLTLLGASPALADAPQVLAPDGDRLHAAIDGVGLVTLDVRDPSAIKVASIAPMPGRWTALVRSGTRLAAIVDRALVIFDGSTSPPIEIGRAEASALFDYVPLDIAWAGDFLALSASGGRGKRGGFGVVDVSVPSKPELRGWVEDENPDVIGARPGRLAVTMIVEGVTASGEPKTEWVLASYHVAADGDLLPLGRVVLDHFGGPVDVVFDGDVAFAGVTLANFVVAVSAPGDRPPTVVSHWSANRAGLRPGVGVVSGLAAAAGRVYVPRTAELGRDGVCPGPGLIALALGPSGELAAESEWSTTDTGTATAVAIDGTTAFVANPGCGLRVYDVSQPGVPQIRDAWWAGRGVGIGDWSGFSSPNTLILDSGRLYASDAGLIGGMNTVRIFDARSLPLVQLGAIDLPGAVAVAVRGTTMVVVGSAQDLNGGPSKEWLRVYDVGDPEGPIETGRIDDELDAVRDIAPFADGLFIAATGRNYHVVEVRRPGEPLIATLLPTNGRPRRLAAIANGDFVSALGTPSGESPIPFGLLDVLAATERTLLAKSRVVEPVPYRNYGSCHRWGLAVDGDRAYVAPMNGIVYEVDVSDPNAARLAATLRTGGGACDVAISGDLMAVADGDAGLALFRRDGGGGGGGVRGGRVFLPLAWRRRMPGP